MSINSKSDLLSFYLNWKKPYVSRTEETLNLKLSLRKKKLFEVLSMKRLEPSQCSTEKSPRKNCFYFHSCSNPVDIRNLELFISYIHSFTDANELQIGLNSIRRLSCELDKDLSFIERLRDSNTLKKMLELIPMLHSKPEFLTEIFWILTNVAACEKIDFNNYLFSCKLSGIVSDLLSSLPLSGELVENIAWMLGNYSNEYQHIRQDLADKGVINFFIHQLIDRSDISARNKQKMLFFLHIALSDTILPEGRDEAKLMKHVFEDIRCYLQQGFQLHSEIQSVIAASIQVLSSCCMKNSSIFKYICKKDGLHLLFALLSNEGKIRKTVIRLFGDFAYQQKLIYSSKLIENHILEEYTAYLRDDQIDLTMKKEIVWTLSNLSSESPHSLDEFFLNEHLIDSLFDLVNFRYADSSLTHSLNKEVFWCISNLTKTEVKNYMSIIIDKGYLKLVSYYLNVIADFRLPMIAMEGLLNILAILKRNLHDDFALKVLFLLRNGAIFEHLNHLVMNDKAIIAKVAENVIKGFQSLGNNALMEL